jgi:ABC-type lipoprotein release transport system permease subunit
VSLPVSPPPPRPERRGLSLSAIVIVAVVVVVVLVGAALAGGFFTGSQQTVSLSKPEVTITDTHGSYVDTCGIGGSKQTKWDWSETLVNAGGTGYVDIGYNVNGQQVMQSSHYVYAKSSAFVEESHILNVRYGSTTPTFSIVVLAERSIYSNP